MKINKDKRIGNVLFIVEGSKTEFIILRKIFCNLLNYTYIEKRRNKLHSFYKENDIYSKIAVINTRESNISDKTLGQEYLDEVFKYLIEECNFPVDDFSNESESIFNMQEENFKNKQYYALFSMLTLAFLQLGIIEM